MSEEKVQAGIFFERLDRKGREIKYPAWRYHDFLAPIIVENDEQDRKAEAGGWKNPYTPIMGNQNFSNFVHDLEDMSVRQLCQYAKDEYDIDLPREATKARLLKAIWDISRGHPKNQGRIVLLAQSMRMNYDKTLDEIRKAAGNIESCSEIETEEIWL